MRVSASWPPSTSSSVEPITSKVVTEQLAGHISDWSGIPFVGLRLSNIFRPEDYGQVASYQDDAQLRRWNLWGYVDVRDVAPACRRGVPGATTGAPNVIVAAADTIMNTRATTMRTARASITIITEIQMSSMWW